MSRAEDPPGFEQELRAFLQPRGVDLDAQAVVFQLYRAATDAIAALEATALRPLGLSHAGFVLLMNVWINGRREIRALAHAHRLSKAAIVSAVGTLERAGLVTRQRSDTDKRLVHVELTAKGQRLVDKAQRALHRCERALTAGLSVREQRQLASLLRRVGAAARNGNEPSAR